MIKIKITLVLVLPGGRILSNAITRILESPASDTGNQIISECRSLKNTATNLRLFSRFKSFQNAVH